MSDWWTYSLSDFLLFSPSTYFRLFALYNAAIWPAHLPAVALGAGVLAVLARAAARWQVRLVCVLLAFVWLWVAWGYLLARYATINWAASYLAVTFAVQAGLFLVMGMMVRQGGFVPSATGRRRLGLGLVGFALFVYPFITLMAGRSISQAEVFAIAPDPTVLATLGMVLMEPRMHWGLFVIPCLWCGLSGLTLWVMAAPGFWIMPVAACLACGAATLCTRQPPAGNALAGGRRP